MNTLESFIWSSLLFCKCTVLNWAALGHVVMDSCRYWLAYVCSFLQNLGLRRVFSWCYLLIYSFLSMLYIPYLFQNSALHFQILCVFNKLKNVFLPQTLLKLIKVVDHRYISLIFSKSPSSVSFCWLVSPLGFGTHVHCSFFAFEQLRNDLFPLITLTKCLLEGKWVLTVNRLLCHFFLYLIMMKIIMNICNL